MRSIDSRPTSLTTSTRVSELRDGKVKTYDVDPLDFVEDYAQAPDLAGGDAETNVAITRAVLSGEAGPHRDIVCLNAAAAIVAGGKAETLKQGWTMAQEAVESGKADVALRKLVEVTNR